MNFNAEERVPITEKLEQEQGNRQGKRTDLYTGLLPAHGPEVKPGLETREFAARQAGFKGAHNYRDAKAVVHSGARNLIECHVQEERSCYNLHSLER